MIRINLHRETARIEISGRSISQEKDEHVYKVLRVIYALSRKKGNYSFFLDEMEIENKQQEIPVILQEEEEQLRLNVNFQGVYSAWANSWLKSQDIDNKCLWVV